MEVLGKQFWLGAGHAGMMVTFWASTEVIHLTIGGARVKSVRSHLSAADLARLRSWRRTARRTAAHPRRRARRRDRGQPGRSAKDGQVSLGGRYYIKEEILGGMMVSIRIEQARPDPCQTGLREARASCRLASRLGLQGGPQCRQRVACRAVT